MPDHSILNLWAIIDFWCFSQCKTKRVVQSVKYRNVRLKIFMWAHFLVVHAALDGKRSKVISSIWGTLYWSICIRFTDSCDVMEPRNCKGCRLALTCLQPLYRWPGQGRIVEKHPKRKKWKLTELKTVVESLIHFGTVEDQPLLLCIIKISFFRSLKKIKIKSDKIQ